MTENLSTFKEVNTDFLVMFNKGLSKDFNLGANLGGNNMHQQSHSTFGAADELAIDGVYTLTNSKVPQRTKSLAKEKVINSIYFSAQLAFRNALFLDITGRNDWSSTLPKGNNSYFYPSFTLSSVLTDLIKMKNTKTLSYAKVRAGWARVGSDTDPYQLLPVLSFGDGWNSSTKYLNQYVPDNLPNADLKPQ